MNEPIDLNGDLTDMLFKNISFSGIYEELDKSLPGAGLTCGSLDGITKLCIRRQNTKFY